MTPIDRFLNLVLFLFILPSQEPVGDQHKAQVGQLEKYLDRELERENKERESRWRRDFTNLKKYIASVNPKRKTLAAVIGGIPSAKTAVPPRRIRVGETPSYFIDRVWLQAIPGVETYGILLTPRAIPSKKAPALICLHGMGSSPEQVCGLTSEEDYTKRFGARAAEQGYVVFAAWMTNDVRTKSRLDRKAILSGTRLQGIEEAKVIRSIDYLESLPEVDPKRIGIYGISWGGRTAMYAAAIDQRIAATVISGHFNDTLPKMVAASTHYTAYIDTAEDYAFFQGLVKEFSDVDVASLIAPRPVFIEQGSKDRVVHYPMAQAEFQRLKSIYHRLGVGDRAEFGLFEGGHIVHGEGAFSFLHRWLMP